MLMWKHIESIYSWLDLYNIEFLVVDFELKLSYHIKFWVWLPT